MKKRSLTIENRSLDIIDGLLTFAEHQRFYNYAYKSKYSIQRESNRLPETRSLQPTLSCHLNRQEIKEHGFVFIPAVNSFIRENKLRIHQYYFILGTASDVYAYHIDNHAEGCKTILCYLNTTWDAEWEGETHFADTSASEILASISFVPGRIAIFDSLIPHKSSQPSFKAEHFRIVLTIKLCPEGAPGYDSMIDVENL